MADETNRKLLVAWAHERGFGNTVLANCPLITTSEHLLQIKETILKDDPTITQLVILSFQRLEA